MPRHDSITEPAPLPVGTAPAALLVTVVTALKQYPQAAPHSVFRVPPRLMLHEPLPLMAMVVSGGTAVEYQGLAAPRREYK